MTEEDADAHMDTHIPHASNLRAALSEYDANHRRALRTAGATADDVHAGPPSLQFIMRSSFPHCKAPVSACSPACSEAINVAHTACEGWTRGDLSDKAAHDGCASAEQKSRDACTVNPSEDASCHESSLGGYDELLRDGGVYRHHAKKHSASSSSSSSPVVKAIHSQGSNAGAAPKKSKFRYSQAARVGQVEQSFGLCMAETGTSMDGQSVECGEGQLMAGFKYSGAMCPEGQTAPETNCVEQDSADVTHGECLGFSTPTLTAATDGSPIKMLSSHLVSCPSGGACAICESNSVA